MQKISTYARTITFFLFDMVLRFGRSRPIFKNVVRTFFRLCPARAQLYIKRMMQPAHAIHQDTFKQPVSSLIRRRLTPQEAVIFSDLKSAISQLGTKVEEDPRFEGG